MRSCARVLLLLVALAAALALAPAEARAAVDAPFSMTDPDGQGLILEDLKIRSAVHGMLSMTEYELTFRNPQQRQIEGRFKALLPQGATLSRLAKEVNGQLMEGEVVERLRAQQIYQQILHTMRDPALLEQDQGNRYEVKIFPIPGGATTRILISYTQLLPMTAGARALEIPLAGLPTIANFSFQGVFAPLKGERLEGDAAPKGVQIKGAPGQAQAAQVVSLRESAFLPEADLSFTWRPEGNLPPLRTYSAGGFILASLNPTLPPATGQVKGARVFYFDTSASAAGTFPQRIEALRQVIAHLPKRTQVEIVAFDQTMETVGKGWSNGALDGLSEALIARGAMGATDLSMVLSDILNRAQAGDLGQAILVSDGTATLGPRDTKDLLPLLGALSEGIRVDAMPLGSRYDEDTLRALVAEGGGRLLPLALGDDVATDAGAVAQGLMNPPGVTLQVAANGAEWIYPTRFYDVQPGAELLIFAKARAGSTLDLTLEGDVLGAGAPTAIGERFAPLMEREAWAAYLGHLEARRLVESDPAVAQALRTQRVALSEQHRVLIPETTLLVLESEADYARYGLERRGLADILTVGPAGIERLKRQGAPVAANPAPKPVIRPMEEGERRAVRREDLPRSPSAADSADGDAELESAMDQAPEAKSAMAMDDAPQAEGWSLGAPGRGLGSLEGVGGGGGGAGESIGYGAAAAPSRSMANESAEPPPPGAQMNREEAVATESRRMGAAPQRLSGGLIVQTDEDEDEDEADAAAPSRRSSVPEWVSAGQLAPTKSELADLREAVDAAPLERPPRLLLAAALGRARQWDALVSASLEWQAFDAENPKVYESLMEALMGKGDPAKAARAAGSFADLSPNRPEMLVRAAYLMMATGPDPRIGSLLDAALALRPDFANTYRAKALFLELSGRFDEGAATLEAALKQSFPGWYGDVARVIREELAYHYRGLIAQGAPPKAIAARAKDHGITLGDADPLRITLTWDTDANDVDLHVVGPDGAECYYQNMQTKTTHLYEDITQGFGPEVAVSRSGARGTYHVGVNYFSAGPMGVSRGVVVVRTAEGPITVAPFGLVPQGQDMAYLMAVEL